MKSLAVLLLLTAGAFAETNDIFVAVERNDVKNVATILKADPSQAGKVAFSGGGTPLHSAAFRGNVEIVKLLLDNGASPNTKDRDNIETPLHRAAACPSNEVVKLLLAKGGDPNIKRRDGQTPLHVAAERGRKDNVATLLAAKADPKAVENTNAFTPLHLAVVYRPAGIWYRGSLAEALKKLEDDYQGIAQLLLDAGATLNAKTKNGKTPLGYAIERKRPEMEAFLRQRNAAE